MNMRAHGDNGIIPVNTGKIGPSGGHMLINWDHPREYGENGSSSHQCSKSSGSSP